MSSSSDCGKGEALCATCFPNHFPIQLPPPEVLSAEFGFASPVQLHGPFLVTDMITYPVIFTNVDEDPDTALEKRGDVVVSQVDMVKIGRKSLSEIHRNHTKIALHTWVNSELGLYLRATEIF